MKGSRLAIGQQLFFCLIFLYNLYARNYHCKYLGEEKGTSNHLSQSMLRRSIHFMQWPQREVEISSDLGPITELDP